MEKVIRYKEEERKENQERTSCYKGEGLLLEEIYNPALTPPFQFAYFLKPEDPLPIPEEKYEDVVNGKVIYPLNDANIEKGIVRLPSMAEEYGDDKTLISEIRSFIHKYVEVDELFEKLSSYYVLLTWIYDCFDVVPYLRVIGDTGVGKTTFLKTVGSICYKPIFCAGAITSAPIFRFIEMYHGTLIIDEADFRRSDGYEEIVKILNCGYTKGMPVLRCRENKSFFPDGYDCFSPKLIATRNTFQDPALESRCITYQMKGREKDDIPLILPPEFYQEALTIRNKLLLWRLRNYKERKIDTTLIIKGIEDRLNQISLPLLSIINNEDFRDELGLFIWEYNQKLIKERGMTTEAEVIETIADLVKDGNLGPTIKEITEKYNEKYAVSEKSKITPKKVGAIIRRLNIETKQGSDGYYHIIYNQKEFEKIQSRFSLIPFREVREVRKSENEPEIDSEQRI